MALVSVAPAAAAPIPSVSRVEIDAAVDVNGEGPAAQRVIDEAIGQAMVQVAAEHGARVGTRLRGVAGRPRDYVLGYRVVKRIGERPGRWVRGADREYAARVAVQVDTPALVRALQDAGLIAAARPETTRGSRTYRIEGPLRWSGWQALRKGLLAAGARRAVPERFDEQGALLRVEGADPDALVRRVVRSPPRGFEVEWSGSGDSARIRVYATGPPS